ncbi:MAG: molecular chaperone DnaJ [Puniceicoccales bacterium]|jgi:molecular chaperone DnaJ|nr:molecular chaperone DnaJ [Puniceicoccales bacterium]
MADDYYQLLGVERGADAETIKKAYRKQAMKYHPDRNQGDKAAEEMFKKVSHAYEVLSDPQKKATYDQFGAAAFEGAAGSARGGANFRDPMDIFRQFFGGMQGGGGGSFFHDIFGGDGGGEDGAQAGEDLRFDLTITLEEAATGVEKTIKYRRYATCSHCHGTGAEQGSSRKQCPDCKGSGQFVRSSGFFAIRQPCPKCGGTGTIIEKPCKNCHGEGRIIESDTTVVKIPKGVDTGVRLRSGGRGSAGVNGGPAGDLYIIVHVADHDLYERDGDDLHYTVPVKFTLAALGGEMEVPTLGGRAKLRIPAGTQSGTTFRLRDKGMPNLRGKGTGDLLVRIEIDVPKKLTADQRAKLEDFAKASGDTANNVSESWTERFKRFLGV